MEVVGVLPADRSLGVHALDGYTSVNQRNTFITGYLDIFHYYNIPEHVIKVSILLLRSSWSF